MKAERKIAEVKMRRARAIQQLLYFDECRSDPSVPQWTRISKTDRRTYAMADAHYTRKKPGAPSWTRPGYNHVLWSQYPAGQALWCWWRPKWEDGRPGTERFDRLRCLECTLFRRTGVTPLASDLIRAAVAALDSPDARSDLHLDAAGHIPILITGVNSQLTSRGRSASSRPGQCYIHAGWSVLDKTSHAADTWLCLQWENVMAIGKPVERMASHDHDQD